jgi:tetratricopeptide (TPR) repeat protein
MGVVYQARHLQLNRLVALKMILGGGHVGSAGRARFRTEAEAVARIQHPGIVQIYEVGEHDGLPYLALEYCAGGSLAGQLDGKPVPPLQAAATLETLARAIHAAHQRSVVHRDLKPANILLTVDGQLKITDFGLAKDLDQAISQTGSGAVMGTPSYMAPEQAWGKSKVQTVGPAADVYALGVILYEMLTARPPFLGETPMDTLQQVLNDEPLAPSRLYPKVPRDLETICLKCLQKAPHKRYASALDLAEDLRKFQAHEPILARPVGRVERLRKWAKRRPALAGLVCVSVFALLTLLIIGLMYQARLRDSNQDLQKALNDVRNERAAADREKRRAQANYQKALDAVNRFLRLPGEVRLVDVPHMDETREELLREALAFYQSFLKDKDHPDPEIRRETAGAFEQTGLIQFNLGRLEQAGESYRQARELIYQLLAESPGSADYLNGLASVSHDEGDLLVTLQQPESAEVKYRLARRIWRQLARDYPAVSAYVARRAVSETSLANLGDTLGQGEVAEDYHREALDLWTGLARKDPKNTGYQNGQAICHHNLATTCQKTNRLGEAKDHYFKALAVFRQQAADSPRNTALQHALATCLDGLANLYQGTGEPKLAEEAFRKALDIRSQLAQDHPQVPDHHLKLAITHHNLAAIHRNVREVDRAEALYRKAIDLESQLVRDYPKIPHYRVALADTYISLGVLLEELKQGSLAEPIFQSARELLEPLARKAPKNLTYASSLGNSYFHLAMMADKNKNPKGAFDLSTRAIDTLKPVLEKCPHDTNVRSWLSGAYGLRAKVLDAEGRQFEGLADLKHWMDLRKPPPPFKHKSGKQ